MCLNVGHKVYSEPLNKTDLWFDRKVSDTTLSLPVITLHVHAYHSTEGRVCGQSR